MTETAVLRIGKVGTLEVHMSMCVCVCVFIFSDIPSNENLYH